MPRGVYAEVFSPAVVMYLSEVVPTYYSVVVVVAILCLRTRWFDADDEWAATDVLVDKLARNAFTWISEPRVAGMHQNH